MSLSPEWKVMDLTPLLRGLESPLTTIELAWQTVPWLYRAVMMRAQTVSSVPWHLTDESGETVAVPAVAPQIARWMPDVLYMAELSRTLYGSAYFVAERNRLGRNITLRHVPSPLVSPRIERGELVSWEIGARQRVETVPLTDMIWSWVPNPLGSYAPGPAPAQVALRAAGLLTALDEMTTRYFHGGAVPIIAVRVPPSVSRDERDRLESWLSNMAAGVRRAFRFLAINRDTEFAQIGANLKETLATEMTAAQRENVAVALGVPPTLLDGKSSNYATAQSEMIGFYLHTIIPECVMLASHLTDRLFAQYGLRFEFKLDSLDALQSIQLEQARTLRDLTGGQPLLTVDEARAWLNLPPLDAPIAAPDDVEQLKRWRVESLARLRSGSSPAVGTPFDAHLAAASSARQVRAIYDAHWPRPDDWRERAVAELSRFNDLQGPKT